MNDADERSLARKKISRKKRKELKTRLVTRRKKMDIPNNDDVLIKKIEGEKKK